VKKSSCLSVLFGVCLLLTAQAAWSQGCQTLSGLTYGTWVDRYGATQPLQLELLLPNGASGPVPVVVWIHGGGWKSGDRTQIPTRVSDLCARGYAVASIDYRLSGDAVWPAQIQDCRGAVRWLRAHAATYGLDPDRFAAWGESAGGHLASMLGTASDVATQTIGNVTVDLEGSTGGNPGVSTRMQAVAVSFGQSDLLQQRFYPTTPNHDVSTSDDSRLLGGLLQDNPERAATASPITYVTPDDPPFLVQHGTADKLIPFNQSELLVDALTAAGVPVTFRQVQGAGHGGTPFASGAPVQAVYDFLDQVLGADAVSSPSSVEPVESVTADSGTLPVVRIEPLDAMAAETGGDGGSFRVTRDGDILTALTVSYSISGTATNGTDYTTLSGSATIPAGAASVNIPVAPLDDDLRETGEMVVLTLSASASYSLGSPRTASVVIRNTDEDPARPTVSVSATDRDSSEPGSNAGAFTVSRTGSTTAPLTVQITTSGSAQPGTDYTAVPSTVTFDAGIDRVTVPINPIEDYVIEGPKDVTLAVVPSPALYVGPYAGSRVALADDDVAGLPVLTGVAVSPASAVGGTSSTGTVTLSAAAPAGGAVVSLSSNKSAATVPSSVTVPAGATSASFNVGTSPVATAVSASISAFYRGVTRTASLTVQPPALSKLTLTPATLAGGCSTSTGKVYLTGKAPAGGIVVTLGNANPAAAVPSSVTVLAGSTSASFLITTSTVASTQSGDVTASLNGIAMSVTLSVRPIGVQSLALAPNPVIGPGRVDGTVTLECPAPSGGIAVALSSSSSGVAQPDVASLTIPGGQSSGTFTVSTADVTAVSTATLKAAANGTSKTVKLTVNP
jgi:acetyl esterase/lipase